ncbi:hypothetical protein ACQKLP_14730 [Chitinophaga sp. NPDC101104]|uniref:hypothetical protein n=1 Tax=Chitinophaga sp. NPDC101104 TaxID=3390561 RepID=UPI003CFEFD9D
MENENKDQAPGQDGSKPIPTKAIQTPYNYVELLKDVEARAWALFSRDYKIHEIDRPVVLKLLAYFLQDEAVAKDEGLDLKKGVLITGPVGCGKTSILRVMRTYCSEVLRPQMFSCREIAFEFAQVGHEIIQRYGRGSFFPYSHVPRVHAYDDLGLEGQAMYWGNSCNVMAEILLSRYDLFRSHEMLTHATTNLNSAELEAAYGNRVRSRMREMFNLVAFSPNSIDKRI